MNNMFKSSDLLKELAPSQGEAVYFLYFSHMAEKINLIKNWDSPVAGKFGHLQKYLQRSTFLSIEMFNLYEPLSFTSGSDIYILLPSFEDFRAFALAEYSSSIDKYRGEWGRIARSLRADFVRGYHYFVISRILFECMRRDDSVPDEFMLVVRDLTNVFMRHGGVSVGRKGFGHVCSATVFNPLARFGYDPDQVKHQFNYHTRRFTVLPFGPLVSDIEHVFRINSISAND